MRTACAEWASFEPIPGHPQDHPELLCFKAESTHFFQGNDLTDLSGTRPSQDEPPSRKALIEKFCLGCQKFTGELLVSPSCDAPLERYPGYAQVAAGSRRFQVADGPDCWHKCDSQEEPAQGNVQALAVSPAILLPGAPKQWSFSGATLKGRQE
jgi:hypothetical protein